MDAPGDKIIFFILLAFKSTLLCSLFFQLGSSVQSSLDCNSSNGTVLTCQWLHDVFNNTEAYVKIDSIFWVKFTNNKEQVSEFYTNCSTNAVTSSASCTITVPRTQPRCLNGLKINFSAVSREENVTNILTFARSQAVLSPPSAIRAVAINTREIKISWAPPSDIGCFRTYFCVELEYISGLDNWSKDTDASRCHQENPWHLTKLSPGTLYGIRMRAKVDSRRAQYGPWSQNVTQQTLEEAPSGLVDDIISKSERVDSDPYKRNVRLSWKGLDVNSSSVSSPSLKYSVVIRLLQRNWITNGTSITIPDLEMFSKYCGSIHAFNSGGNGERATFCIPDNSSVPRIPSVNFTSHPTSILVSIYTPKLPNGVIRKYEIRWKEDCSTCLDSWSNITLNVTSKDWLAPISLIEQDISLLQPSAWYIIEIEVFNKEGSSKRSRRLKTGLHAPSAPPRNVTITTVKDEPEVVDITWTSDESDVLVSGYQILYCALDDANLGHNTHCNDSEKIIRFNRSDVGEHNLIRISSLIPFTRYSFRLQPFNNAGPGPISAPVVVRTLRGVPSPLEDVNVSLTSSFGFADFTWSEPLRPNGVTYYEISYNGNSVRTNSTFVQLKVYGDSVYDVGVKACSTGGLCSAAIKKTFKTPIGAPSSPRLGKVLPSGPTTVKVYWDPPEHPNGPIKDYIIKTRSASIANQHNVISKVVDVDRREDDVLVECGDDVGEDEEFRVEIFARTVNEHGLKLDGESDTARVDMCGAKKYVPDMVYVLLIIPALIFVVLLFAIIYRQWFKESRKLNIYLSAIANVRKRSRRLQQLRIPKPMEPERETFDVINQCPSNIYIEDKLHKDKELIYHLLVTDGTTKNVPSSEGYTCMTKYKSCSVLSTRPESLRQDVCDAINGKGRSSDSNGYLPNGIGGRISKLTVPCVESLSKKLLSVPANSYLTQSLPTIDVLTNPSPYRDKKDVGWEHQGMQTIDKPKDVAKNPPKPIHRTKDGSVSDYCTLSEL